MHHIDNWLAGLAQLGRKHFLIAALVCRVVPLFEWETREEERREWRQEKKREFLLQQQKELGM